jgi:cobalt/nickel transport system permease protein
VSSNNNFIERSILGALSFLKESVFADEYASRNGFLQSLDQRIKVVTFLLFILAVLFTKSIAVSLCLYAACLILACFSNVGIGFFLKRTWVFIPLFSLFIAIPALFSVFSPGEPVMAFKAASLQFVITRPGLSSAALFVMRVVTSVSFVVLLSITTKHFALLKALRTFKIPQVFVMTLGMCVRYIYLFVEIIEHTYCAIKSRVGTRVHQAQGRHIVAWNIAYLWQRSYHLNEDVYKAMLSRGYQGEPVALDEYKLTAKDWLWLLCVLSVSALVFYYDHRLNG